MGVQLKGDFMEIKKLDLRFSSTSRKLERVEYLIQHHVAHPTWGVKEVHNFHKKTRGWFGIGYNYFIYKDGTIAKGRGKRVGAHSGSKYNGRSLGICYQGDFQNQQMTSSQVESGAWLNAKFFKGVQFRS